MSNPKSPQELFQELGRWRLERRDNPFHAMQLVRLVQLEGYVSAELGLDEPDTGISIDDRSVTDRHGLALSVLPQFKYDRAINNATPDAPIHRMNSKQIEIVMNEICEPFKDPIETEISAVTVTYPGKRTRHGGKANVYLDLDAADDVTGLNHVYNELSALTGYTDLIAPRTSHIRLMSIDAEYGEAAKRITQEALLEVDLSSLAFQGLTARRVMRDGV